MGCSVNKAWSSWTLLNRTAMVGQMGTSGSLPQRFSNGSKASKDNPIGHCQAEAPRSPSTRLGRLGFFSLRAEEGEWQGNQLCICSFFAYNPRSCDHGRQHPRKVGRLLRSVWKILHVCNLRHTNGPQLEAL